MKQLRQIDGLPPGLLERQAPQLLDALGAPTLLRLKARRTATAHPLLISLLLHGNEVSGWEGLRRVLRTYPMPAFDLLIFIGNPEAAAAGVRTLPNQADCNRIWRPATGVAAELLGALQGQPLQAVVDLHNNTGKNPHYGVLTDLHPQSLGLARLFSAVGVVIEEPDSVLTRAFAERGAPSVALELGPIGDPGAADRAATYCAALFDNGLPQPCSREDLRLFRTLARIHAPEDAAFAFTDNAAPSAAVRGRRHAQGIPPRRRFGRVLANRKALPSRRRSDRGSSAGASAGPSERRRPDGMPFLDRRHLGEGLPPQLDLLLDSALEANNFHPLPPGTSFGLARNGAGLKVLDNQHQDVTEQFLHNRNGRIVAAQTLIPAMYTTDAAVVRRDCLCYLMAPALVVGAEVGL